MQDSGVVLRFPPEASRVGNIRQEMGVCWKWREQGREEKNMRLRGSVLVQAAGGSTMKH